MTERLPDLLYLASQVTFWISFAFPFVMSLFWPWWKNPWGWNIMALETVIWLSLVPTPLHALFGLAYGPVLSWIQVVAVFTAGAVVLWRGVLIFLAQRQPSEEPPAASPPPRTD
jgi:hypothetical protein